MNKTLFATLLLATACSACAADKMINFPIAGALCRSAPMR